MGAQSADANFGSCACTGRNLPKLVGAFALAILAGGPAHGYAVVERLAELDVFALGPPRHPGVYRLLRRMAADGYLVSRVDRDSGGPARRVYAITPAGRACLTRWQRSLSEYRQAIDAFLRMAVRST